MYSHRVVKVLHSHLTGPRKRIQMILGPRQVGKTTAVKEVSRQQTRPTIYGLADQAVPLRRDWINRHWTDARARAKKHGQAVLVLDEIQKIDGWTTEVKRLWDEDTHNGRELRVVLTASAALTLQKDLTEKIAGCLQVIRMPHWSYAECKEAFGWSLDDYILFGGYPRAGTVHEEDRWRDSLMTSIIEPVLTRDIGLLTTVKNPGLLRRVLFLACDYAAQELSYRKIQNIFQDVSSTIIIASYQRMLEQAFLIAALQKWSGKALQGRSSSPKWLPLNTGLITAAVNKRRDELHCDPLFWSRIVKTCVGAHLFNASCLSNFAVYYWREGHMEIDYIVSKGSKLLAIEVKTSYENNPRPFKAFLKKYPKASLIQVGPESASLEKFLMTPLEAYLT